MQIVTRLSTSVDGYVTTWAGWPVLTADPAFVSARATASPSSRSAARRCSWAARPLSPR